MSRIIRFRHSTKRCETWPEPRHYLGHRNFQNTTRHTALAPDRVKGFWRD